MNTFKLEFLSKLMEKRIVAWDRLAHMFDIESVSPISGYADMSTWELAWPARSVYLKIRDATLNQDRE